MIEIIEDQEALETLLVTLKERGNMDTGEAALTTKEIVGRVRNEGNRALFEYTQKFDCPFMDESKVKVTAEEMKVAFDGLPEDLQNAMILSA